MTRVPPGLSIRVLARSFLIQGSWNYRTMIGTGMAFALMPLLRYLHRDDADFERAVDRHAGHFNAHPYLAELALGSLVRLEEDRADETTIRRFRAAVGGPLGALGDKVVWATWLPLAALLALVLLELGVGWWIGVGLFLLVYNGGHLALRLWAFRTGLNEGAHMASRLRTAGLAGRARRAERVLVVLAGLLAGLLLTGQEGLAGAPWPWTGGAVLALLAGLGLGTRAWRPTALVVVFSVGLILVPDLVS